MFSENEITEEEENKLIDKIANQTMKFGMGTPSLLFLGFLEPVAFVGGELAQYTITPFLDFIGIDQPIFQVFKKRENIEKLSKKIESMVEEEKKKKDKEVSDDSYIKNIFRKLRRK